MASSKVPPLLVSQEAEEVLDLLRMQHNVLISGAPATGKSRLLADVARGFLHQTGGPAYVPTARISIPATSAGPPPPYLPSPTRKNRQVFPTTFDQGTRLRDFLRGLVPVVDAKATSLSFKVYSGTLYRASEHALSPTGAALVIVDEINRGPAVAIFGPSIVALESDKRLDDAGAPTGTTQPFELLDDAGNPHLYALPTHLYILAAMNQADTSIEALDVAFLRRFVPYQLLPDENALNAHFGISASVLPSAAPNSAGEVYALLVSAWRRVNEHLRLGRGPEYQIGHGVLMLGTPPSGLSEATAYAARGWRAVRQHVDEVFFGDTRGVGEMLAAGRPGSPYSIVDKTFAGQPVVQLNGPTKLTPPELLAVLKAIAES